MKLYWELIKLKVSKYFIDNWNSPRYYDKVKIIFISIVLIFLLIKIVYSIFV
jgi:hypothetical protein